MTKYVAAATLALAASTPAFAQSRAPVMIAPPPAYVAPRRMNDQQLLHIYRDKLAPLREEILARTAAEGGDLTPASRAEFQERLDTINVEFRRFVRKQQNSGANGAGFQEG